MTSWADCVVEVKTSHVPVINEFTAPNTPVCHHLNITSASKLGWSQTGIPNHPGISSKSTGNRSRDWLWSTSRSLELADMIIPLPSRYDKITESRILQRISWGFDAPQFYLRPMRSATSIARLAATGEAQNLLLLW